MSPSEPPCLGCVFCSIVRGQKTGEQVIYEDEHALGFLALYPVLEGHTVVIPKTHCANLWDVSELEAGDTMVAVVRVAALLRRALKPQGLSLVQATGEAAFQSVFHLHFNLLPRSHGDRLRSWWTPTAGRPALSWAELATLADRIREAT